MTNARPRSSTLGATSIWQLVRERRTRDAIYHASDYWDARAASREGLARSVWPSNVFNERWDERQRVLLARTLGDMRGRRVVDIGCGTGRMTRYFAAQGASEVVGVDFSPATIAGAREETDALGISNDSAAAGAISFAVGDVVAGLDHVGAGTFDDAIVLGCLSVACRDVAGLERAFANIARLLKPGGRLLLLEPIHRSPLLRRVLNLGLEEWIAAANQAGLRLTAADRMGFAPVRLVLSVRDLPRALVRPVFALGEAILDRAPWMAPLSDYKLLLFRADGDPRARRP